MRFFDKYTKLKKIICLILVSALMTTFVGGYSLSTRAREDDFEASIAAFPESYKPLLRELHKTHPNWTFIAFDTGLDWDVVLKNQMKLSRNLMPNGTMGINGKWFKTPTSWKDITINGSYSWTGNDWVELCGGGWVQASTEAVEYIMDPRNWITEENIFAFEMLSFNEDYQTYEVIKSMMENTFMDCDYAIVGGTEPEPLAETEPATSETEPAGEVDTVVDETTGEVISDTEGTSEINGNVTESESSDTATPVEGTGEQSGETTPADETEPTGTETAATEESVTEETTTAAPVIKGKTYAEVLLETGKIYGVSPIHLCARLIQEKGRGVYNSATGQYELKDKLASGRVGSDGKIYYNFFNIGANGSTTEAVLQNGTNEAQKEGWDSQYKAIMGGASKVANNYIKIGQDTVYFQKFSVVNPAYYYWKQYMQNLLAPVNEGYNMRKTYMENGILESDFVFRIPIYNNMPENICPMPEGDGNPNYKLEAISVTGITVEDKVQKLTLTPTFNMDVDTYSVIVPYDVEKVKISAAAIALNTSNVTGIGWKKLKVGKNTFEIVCESEYGLKKTYTVNITRSEGSMYLTSLSTSSVQFKEQFKKTKYAYSMVVDSNIDKIDVFYDKESEKSYVEYRNGEIVIPTENGVVSQVPLVDGKNEINLDVYASSDDRTRCITYTILVIKRSKPVFESLDLQVDEENKYINGFIIGETVENALTKLKVSNGSVIIKDSKGITKKGTDLIATGDVVCMLDINGFEHDNYTVIIYGDVSGDGNVDLFDYAYFIKHYWVQPILTGIKLEAADIYAKSDGVDLLDMAVIIKYLWKDGKINQLR